MKEYQILLKKDNGTEETVIISAENENDARWEGKQKDGVYEAVVLRVNKKKSKYYINN